MSAKRQKMLEQVISAIIDNDPAKAKKLVSATILEMAREIHEEMVLKENDDMDHGDMEKSFEDEIKTDHSEPDADDEPGFEGPGDGDEDDLGLDEVSDSTDGSEDDLNLDSIDGEGSEEEIDFEDLNDDISEVESAIDSMEDVPTDLDAAFEKLKAEFESMTDDENVDLGDSEEGLEGDEDGLELDSPDSSEDELNLDDNSEGGMDDLNLDEPKEDELTEAYDLENVPGNNGYGKSGDMGKESGGQTSLGAPDAHPKSPVAGPADFLSLGEPFKLINGSFSDPNGTSAQTPLKPNLTKEGGKLGEFRNQQASLVKVNAGKTIEDPKMHKDGRLLGESKPSPNKAPKHAAPKSGTPIKPKAPTKGKKA